MPGRGGCTEFRSNVMLQHVVLRLNILDGHFDVQRRHTTAIKAFQRAHGQPKEECSSSTKQAVGSSLPSEATEPTRVLQLVAFPAAVHPVL